MLELKNIKKDYPAGSNTVHALKGVSVNFRKSEFVSILGPSGCGKTTLLNIIGGLDQYTEGELIIKGVSTKDYADRDWDSYRNHSVGFVFQSYNLIPHQSVLGNVELALSLSGVSRKERKQRAIKALEEVGLGDQLNKKPGEMSGGQMQRVAIARALVNNPDIILADEPTGALDTETSVQVMEILKEISKDRLIVMVTHNPDIAEKYSTRIIKMLDGLLVDDSNPLSSEELAQLTQNKASVIKKGGEKKPSLKFTTSFLLSLKNLFTKKGRTILTSFAGSIGIIGIALIFSVSQGMKTYIDVLQEDTLSSYPLTIEAQHTSLNSLITAFAGNAQSIDKHENDAVYQKAMLYNLINSLNSIESTKNDLKSFKEFVEKELADTNSKLYGAVSGVQYTYNTELLVYTKGVDGNVIRSDTNELMMDLLVEYMGLDLTTWMDLSNSYGTGSMMTMGSSLWQEMLSGIDPEKEPVNDVLKKQYDLVYGQWPEAYNEIILVVDENNEVDDLTLYALGLKSKADIDELADAAFNKKEIQVTQQSWSFEEICSMEYRVILNSDCYSYDSSTGKYTDLRNTQSGLNYLYGKAIPLKVTGIVRQSEDAVSGMITGSIGYTSLLTSHIITAAKESPAVDAQLSNPEIDIFTGLPFSDSVNSMTTEEKAAAFDKYVSSFDTAEKAENYIAIKCIPDPADIKAMVDAQLASISREEMNEMIIQVIVAQGSSREEIEDAVTAMKDEDIKLILSQVFTEQISVSYAQQVQNELSSFSVEELAMFFDAELAGYTVEQKALYHDAIREFSDSTYEENLIALGCVYLDDPSAINFFASSFANKDIVEEVINQYNEGVDEQKQLNYTDLVGLMMSSVTLIIDAITYVLVAFVAVSLIVSSIMIGVITLISVQERTKEIGILRAIGASKKNVSGMFTAETLIIGFTAGLLGVIVTYILCIPINAILFALTNIPNLKAILPVGIAIVLVFISMLLTLVAGLIPSKSAAKKDPVVALRSE